MPFGPPMPGETRFRFAGRVWAGAPPRNTLLED